MSDVNPDRNRDTFRGRGARIREIEEQSRKIERLIDIVREVAPDRLEDKIYQDWKTEAFILRAENAAMQQHIQELQERLNDL